MVYKSDFKDLFQSSLKEMLTKKDKQAKKKENAEGDDDSLDTNVFEKLMEGKHPKIVNKSNDGLISRAGALEWYMSYCWWFNRRQVELPLSAVGFHHSGSHHSCICHTSSIWVATSMEAPLSD
jgi:hypothetical protein